MSIESATTSTVQKYIASQTIDDINYDALSFLAHLDGINLPIKNVVEDYLEDIDYAYFEIEMNDEEYLKYKYKPKLLSYDIYGSTELYFIIMRINGIYSMKDFTKRKLKMLRKDSMLKLVSSIYSVEKDIIDAYNLK